MSKSIVFCADGTWEDSTKNTNVYRFYKALTVSANQMPFYDDGVGADGLPLNRVAGGAFGAGLYQKIKDGYTKIAQVYEAGDCISLIGFSRGAYTVRCLGGMITACGLPTANFTDDMVDKAFDAYRDKDDRAKILATLNQTYKLADAPIAMVGVWDTVGSLGIPAVIGGVDPILYGFLDTGLHPDVQNAFQALALDERRLEFPPTLWTGPFAPGQTVEQVWFCGVHSDVGGGYSDDTNGTALSDITLAWMMAKAATAGLVFAPGVFQQYSLPIDSKYALDSKHESWSVLWAIPKSRTVPPNSSISDSVYFRCEQDHTYQPRNLTFTNGAPASTYQRVSVISAAQAAAAGV
jgi:uncharacterized protein (DUF2235 family)